MKKIIIWIKHFFEKIFRFLLNLFRPVTKNKKIEIESKKSSISFKNHTEPLKHTPIELPETNSSQELKIKSPETALYSQEEIKKIFYDFLERTLKIKIDELPYEEQKKLEEYTAKSFKKIEPVINKQKQKDKEKVEKTLKENLERDLEKKDLNLEKLIILTTPIPTKREKIEIINNSIIEKPNTKEATPIIEITPNQSEKNESTSIIDSDLEIKSNHNSSILMNLETPLEEKINESVIVENYIDSKQSEEAETLETISKEAPIIVENIEPENAIENKQILQSKQEIDVQKKEDKKTEIESKITEPIITPLEINFDEIENKNKKVIEEVKAEYSKEDLIDKDYELVEELLEKRINDIEKTLQKTLNSEQKTRLKSELEKLKETKKQLYLYKEKDIEDLRISLEENIPVSELVLVNKKLKELTEDEKIEKNKLLLKNIEYKSQQEIKKMELILIKDYYKKALRRSLYFSFPFIKNKHFRRFVAGLFVFRTFGFLKHLLFQIPDEYEPIDLSSIQKGNDALVESVAIMEKNIESFQNLKNATLLKYPELLNDKNFTKDVNKLEKSLMQNYEKLLRQQQTVKKYFDTSKDLIRSRKYSI